MAVLVVNVDAKEKVRAVKPGVQRCTRVMLSCDRRATQCCRPAFVHVESRVSFLRRCS